jgi:hypothetical protein
MKKVLLLTILMSSLSTMAATLDSIDLQATIDGQCSIDIDEPNYVVDMIAGESNSVIASVSSESNFVDGYTLQGDFDNGGNMKNGSHQVAVSLKYGSTSISDASIFFTNSGPTLGTPDVADLKLSIAATPALSLVAGSYSEQLTITCAALSP